jgi:hypothetical protein
MPFGKHARKNALEYKAQVSLKLLPHADAIDAKRLSAIASIIFRRLRDEFIQPKIRSWTACTVVLSIRMA